MNHLDEYALDIVASGPDPRQVELPQAELPEGWSLTALRRHLASCSSCCDALAEHQGFFADLVVDAGARVGEAQELHHHVVQAIRPPSPLSWRWTAAAAVLLAIVLPRFGLEPATPDHRSESHALASDLEQMAQELGIDLEWVRSDEEVDPIEERALALDGYRAMAASDASDNGFSETECLFGCSLYTGLLELSEADLAVLQSTLEQAIEESKS